MVKLYRTSANDKYVVLNEQIYNLKRDLDNMKGDPQEDADTLLYLSTALHCVKVRRRVCALQRVALCCSALHRDAVCCSVLQCIAVYCSMLQCVAVCCSVLQCVIPQHGAAQHKV